MTRKQLLMLNPREYEHPLDKKALNMLEGTPGLEKVTRYFYKHGLERMLRVQYTGSYLKVTKTQFPDIYKVLEEVCATIHLNDIPDLYINNESGINGFAVGSENPMIVISRRAVDWLPHEELIGLIGHEAGHIKSGHMLYQDMAQVIPLLGSVVGSATLGIGNLVSAGLEAALFEWYRKSELTADRAGVLACQDYKSFIKVLIKISGAPKTSFDKIDVNEFINQAREFESYDYDSMDKVAKAASIMWQDHPWTVLRASELLKWVESGEYDKILDKDASDTFLCFSCGAELKVDEKFCGECGVSTSTR